MKRPLLTIVAAVFTVTAAFAQKDVTSQYLTNPNFESGTDGWVVAGFSTQTNTSFSRKNGSTYLETWVDRGSKINDASLTQTIKALPKGKYRLSANALHIQQKSSGGEVNATNSPQTGAWLTADAYQITINRCATYNLEFAVIDEKADVTVGARAENATGNWFCIDNFKLYYIGELDLDALVAHLQMLENRTAQCVADGVQNTVRAEVETASAAAQAARTAEPLDETQLREAISLMNNALKQAEASNERYVTLRETIAYAEKVLGWWEGLSRKAAACNRLREALETASQQAVNYDLTDAELKSAATTLTTRTKAVDKKIYESGSAVGTGSALTNTNSQWCYQRSLQSKHWILFWEKGYGDAKPAGIDDILATADRIFEFYADSLKFITVNQGKSKTDTYKMIIRLRSTTEWEASGSGIDNTIGLLTLSRWAYTSRGGQTVAHEIGHCFQYQVHCDNNNQNGWMYTWANSGNGNVFWEMCAQWQAYKFYPNMQFDNEWLNNTLNGLHKNPICEELRYNNYFIQDYWAHVRGMDIIAKLWNQSRNPEDPFQTYMRLMWPSKNAAKRLESLNDEMWDYAARMTTFDMDHIRAAGKSTIGKRAQTQMKQLKERYWLVNASDCPENFGNNAIRLNVPSKETVVTAEFVGLADTTGYRGYKTQYAGWRVGFVALLQDGTRLYGDVAAPTAAEPEALVEFTCHAKCSALWLVVSGAPTQYWSRGWNGTENDDEQWPYKVRFYYTNLQGKTNYSPTGIEELEETPDLARTDNNVYSVAGTIVRRGTTSLSGLPRGIYVVNGKKVAVR